MMFAQIPLETAIVSATAAPARLLGIERDCGTLEPHKRADFTVWDEGYQVVATFVGGRPVYGGETFREPSTDTALLRARGSTPR
jgi:N-acetylglucosamine-6-phosphate deacetylase